MGEFESKPKSTSNDAQPVKDIGNVARADTKQVLDRRDAPRSTAPARLAALPSEINFGQQRAGRPSSIDLPLIITEEFVGRGVATPKITKVEGVAGSFTTDPRELVFNAHSRLEKLPVHFDPKTNGVSRARMGLSVLWTDGQETTLQTALVGIGDGVSSKPEEIVEPTVANLDQAYDEAGVNMTALFEKRAIGVRSALANMQAADSPSLSEQLITSLAISALGLASGWITGAIVARLAARVDKMVAEAAKEGIKGLEAMSEGIKNGFQTALDDGAKDAVVVAGKALKEKLYGGSDGDKIAFFAGQEEGLVDAKTKRSKGASKAKAEAKNAVERAPESSRAAIVGQHIEIARAAAQEVDAELGDAVAIQYRTSLSRWMVAVASEKYGESKDPSRPGTDLEDAVDVSPKDHLLKARQGVINVSFRAKRQRPLGGTTKIGGMTKAAFGPLKANKSLRVRDLKMPIVASGYLASGWDANISNNEIAFGKNEDGTVFWKGHGDAIEVLQDLTNAPTVEEAVRIVIREDIEPRSLEHVETES